MHCPLFVELCAGTAALSLRLHKDGAKPPVSRMGAKTGYADRILTLLGLVPGQGADAYLWCEPDPGVRLLLEAYRDAGLARAAAAIIRSWAAEDPRQLWERLRAEGPPKLPEVGDVTACAVARWAFVQRVTGRGVQWGVTLDLNGSGGGDPRTGQRFPFSLAKNTIPIDAYEVSPATITSDAREVDPREVARWSTVQAGSILGDYGHGPTFFERYGHNPKTGERYPGNPAISITAPALDALDTIDGALIHPDAREVDPREVARWTLGEAWQNGGRYMGPDRPSARREVEPNRTLAITAEGLARRAAGLPAIDGALIRPDARDIDPPALPPGTVAYLDGPYENTTQYANLLPRAEQVAIARRWAAAGAVVAISEAEAIPELVAEGWFAVEITGQRFGAARTFSKQKREFLTMNREPVEAVGPLFDLFGG